MSDSAIALERRLPIGAELIGDGRAHLRVWAPARRRVAVHINNADIELTRDANGYFAGEFPAAAGDRYQLRVDADEKLYPDPASRYQPDGPHGPSVIVDPTTFRWNDAAWRGVRIEGQVVYELHVGTFTPEGTWTAAIAQLSELARIGITLIEVMPVAEFDGRFGWGYDGVDLFAPMHVYGAPDDFRQFVNAAHQVGLGVILDVVYNHLGPVGNYLRVFAPQYFSEKYENEWGDALNFDGADSGPVREFFTANAAYWIDEFHLDGLRLDATQQIFDASPQHVLVEIGQRARDAAKGRSIVLIAENEPQDARLIRPADASGYGLDAVWNDDFHHAAVVAMTGRNEAYYSDTHGHAQEFVSAAKYGYLFQGQYYHWQRQSRGTPAFDASPAQFVSYLQNHDQIANSATGLRGHLMTSPARWRALTALTLLMPSTPMLFQGQEFGSSAPFLYFADHEPELAAAVRKGRAEFLGQFPSIRDFLERGHIADPSSPATFERCKLDFSERTTHCDQYALHQDLLRVRREDAVFRQQRPHGVDGAVVSSTAFVLRFFADDPLDDRLLFVNLGADCSRRSIADPLTAPPLDTDWAVRWSSEDPMYGGLGTPDPWPGGCWFVPAETALLLAPGPKREPRAKPKLRRTA